MEVKDLFELERLQVMSSELETFAHRNGSANSFGIFEIIFILFERKHSWECQQLVKTAWAQNVSDQPDVIIMAIDDGSYIEKL